MGGPLSRRRGFVHRCSCGGGPGAASDLARCCRRVPRRGLFSMQAVVGVEPSHRVSQFLAFVGQGVFGFGHGAASAIPARLRASLQLRRRPWHGPRPCFVAAVTHRAAVPSLFGIWPWDGQLSTVASCFVAASLECSTYLVQRGAWCGRHRVRSAISPLCLASGLECPSQSWAWSALLSRGPGVPLS